MPHIDLTVPKSVGDNRFISMIIPIREAPPSHSCLLNHLLQKVTAVWASCPPKDTELCTYTVEQAVETPQNTNPKPLFTQLFHTTAQTISFPFLQ